MRGGRLFPRLAGLALINQIPPAILPAVLGPFKNLTAEDIVMQRFVFAIVAWSASFVVLARADDRPAPVKGPPPEFIQVVAIDKDKGIVKIQSCSAAPATRIIKQEVGVGGRKIVQEIDVGGEQATEKVETLKLATLRLLDAQGKEIKGDEAWKKLAEGKVLLRQAGQEPIDHAYLKLLSKDALILAPKLNAELKPK
jgi:hypothetical protein